jgi:hypothetical protein
MILLAITRHTGIRLAELGFLFWIVAGAWMVFGQIAAGGRRPGAALAGLAVAAGGVLLIIATHWGHFS